MGVTIVKQEEINTDAVELDRKLWYTADRAGFVEDGHEDARSLIGVKGDRITVEEAKRIGLLDDQGEPTQFGDEYLEDMTVEQLRGLARDRGLQVSGTKAELIERIADHDEAVAEQEAEPDSDEDDEEDV